MLTKTTIGTVGAAFALLLIAPLGQADAATAPPEFVEAATAATALCDVEVVDTELVLTEINALSAFDVSATSAAGAQGPAQFLPQTWAIYGADDDRNGVASPYDVADAVGALTRLNCTEAHTLAAQGHVVDEISVIAALWGGVGNVDDPEVRTVAEQVWAKRGGA